MNDLDSSKELWCNFLSFLLFLYGVTTRTFYNCFPYFVSVSRVKETFRKIKKRFKRLSLAFSCPVIMTLVNMAIYITYELLWKLYEYAVDVRCIVWFKQRDPFMYKKKSFHKKFFVLDAFPFLFSFFLFLFFLFFFFFPLFLFKRRT